MTTQQRTFLDYSYLGDTGTDDIVSIQPIADGEAASQNVFRRPSENLRSRTEILRSALSDFLYKRDHTQYLLKLSGAGLLTWAGTVALGGTGIVNNTTALSLQPLLSPTSNIKGVLAIGTAASNQVRYEVQAAAYASDGMNAIIVEHRDVTGTVTPVCTISEGPIKRIVVVFDSLVAAHDSPTVVGIVNTALGGDTLLNGKLLAVDNGSAGVAILGTAEVPIDTRVHTAGTSGNATADLEEHTLAAGALSTFTTGRPLIEGDVLAVRYDYVVEPVGGDANDPKGGVPGGRSESNSARGNSAITANLFVVQDNPEWLPGAIPIVKIINNVARWVDGTTIVAGTSGVPGTSAGTFITSSGFAGVPTLVVNGGIDNTVTTLQDALTSIDGRLSQHRWGTFVCTDGTASTGGAYNGVSAVADAITALGGAGGTIYVRRGTYTSFLSVPVNVTVICEGKDLVTFTLGALVNGYASGFTASTDVTVTSSGYVEDFAAPGVALYGGATAKRFSCSGALYVSAALGHTYAEQFTAYSASITGTCTLAVGEFSGPTSNIPTIDIANSARVSMIAIKTNDTASQTTAAQLNLGYGVTLDAKRCEFLISTGAGGYCLANAASGLVGIRANFDACIFNCDTWGSGPFNLVDADSTSTDRHAFTFVACQMISTSAAAATGAARMVGCPGLVLKNCRIYKSGTSVTSFTGTGFFKNCQIGVSWNGAAAITNTSLSTGTYPLTFEDCRFVVTNAVTGGYTRIYGASAGNTHAMIEYSQGTVIFRRCDWSTPSTNPWEVDNNAGTPTFSGNGVFINASGTAVTRFESSGFMTLRPRHAALSSGAAVRGWFYFGGADCHISDFQCADTPTTSVQTGTPAQYYIFCVAATNVNRVTGTTYVGGTTSGVIYPATVFGTAISAMDFLEVSNCYLANTVTGNLLLGSGLLTTMHVIGCTFKLVADSLVYPQVKSTGLFTGCAFILATPGTFISPAGSDVSYTFTGITFTEEATTPDSALALIDFSNFGGTKSLISLSGIVANITSANNRVFANGGTLWKAIGNALILRNAGTGTFSAEGVLSPAAGSGYAGATTIYEE